MAGCAVVLGYGLFDESKTTYKAYLDNFVRSVNGNDIGKVVLCGGATDPAKPSVSEASSIRDYVKPLLKRGVEVILEEGSITTDQNIRFAASSVDVGNAGAPISVFCDNVRPPKVIWYVLAYWFGLNKQQIIDYLLDYFKEYYAKHMTTEQLGKLIATEGMIYRNVRIVPFRMRTDIDDATGNILSTLVSIEVLYNKRLYRKFVDEIKIKFGLK